LFRREGFSYEESGLPAIDENAAEWVNEDEPVLTVAQHEQEFENHRERLNDSQRAIFDQVEEILQHPLGEYISKMIFANGPAGAGKTYLFEVSISLLISKN
jgi:hypothetical protein